MDWRGRRLGAAGVILNRSGSVLLVRHTYGRLNWELPGGASEQGESVVETVTREVREETGLRIDVDGLTGVYFELENDAHHFVFRCTSAQAYEAAPASEEISECRFCDVNDLPRPISDFTIRRIMDALTPGAEPVITAIPSRTWLDPEPAG